ncbi:MAG: hypothetical protein VX206_08475 [Pseudomonadota bacterium]|nr:hypothetical protein [Pseudomonadota bacterium]
MRPLVSRDIAVGHPLALPVRKMIIIATHQLERMQGRYATISLCIGIGQGIAAIIECI